jgi:serine/threonine-protein kinase
MATVESPPVQTRHNFAGTDSPTLVGRLGQWQLVRLLSEGNFTRVYQARPADQIPTEAGESVTASQSPAAYVLKVLRKEWWRDPQAIEMQRREVWVGSRVSHPNLLPVLSASVQEPPFYLVAPKLEAISLSQLIAERAPLAVPLALWIARQVADGIDALFTATGMIHADVKPANILVSSTGHATLIDFGFVQSPSEATRWSTRPLAGTLAYIAPEMVTSALAASPRSDIYSLGVTLYEMLTGRRPWESDDPGELATLHREAKPPMVRALRPNVPDAVADLLQEMLAKDQLRRPASARELAARLVRLEIESFSLR